MSIAISLSSTLGDQLQNQATRLGISLNELVEKLIRQSLSKKIEQESVSSSVRASSEGIDSAGADRSGRFTMAEIIERAKSRPRNSASIHLPTGTLDEVLAAFEAKTPSVPRMTPEEWEEQWWPIRQEMRDRDKMRQSPFDTLVTESL